MTAAERRRRQLRPGSLIRVGGEVWVVDEVQPVALRLDAGTARPSGLIDWPELPAGPRPRERRVFGADLGMWLQQPDGPVFFVGLDGGRSGHHVSSQALGAVTSHGAWAAPAPRAQDLAATADAPPREFRRRDQLRLAVRDAVTRTVHVDGVVVALREVEGDLFVEVENGTWRRRRRGDWWALEPQTAWLRLRADQAVPLELSRTDHAHQAPPPRRSVAGYRTPLPTAAEVVEAPVPHEKVGVVDCHLGTDATLPAPREELWALVRDRVTGRERWRVLLGRGTAVARLATGDHVWVVVRHPPRRGAVTAPAPASVVRVDTVTGRAETVVQPDAVDVTGHGWPLGPPPLDAADYAAFWRRRFDRLDTFWTDPSGAVGPLTPGLSDSRVEVVGEWPGTALHLTFAWTGRPGMRLRRVVPLYDELGRHAAPQYADIHLMEDLETGRVPTAPDPGIDVLDL